MDYKEYHTPKLVQDLESLDPFSSISTEQSVSSAGESGEFVFQANDFLEVAKRVAEIVDIAAKPVEAVNETIAVTSAYLKEWGVEHCLGPYSAAKIISKAACATKDIGRCPGALMILAMKHTVEAAGGRFNVAETISLLIEENLKIVSASGYDRYQTFSTAGFRIWALKKNRQGFLDRAYKCYESGNLEEADVHLKSADYQSGLVLAEIRKRDESVKRYTDEGELAEKRILAYKKIQNFLELLSA
ncbi:MAG: hypothetical protein M1355_02785 [Patescibacteria group bacterium]|nr:hypothetical protein [Patescibacteria group bacterium]